MSRNVMHPDSPRALDELGDEFRRISTGDPEGARRGRGGKIAIAAVSVCCFVVAAGVTGVLVDRRGGDSSERGAGAVGFEASGPRYGTISDLVRASDLIITGTVEEVIPGEVEGPPGEEIHHTNALVRVEDTWKGSASGPVVTVETLSTAFAGPGPEEWREPGENVLLFLSASREPESAGSYILANAAYSQTAYVLFGDDVVQTVSDPLGQVIAGLTRPELRDRVRQRP